MQKMYRGAKKLGANLRRYAGKRMRSAFEKAKGGFRKVKRSLENKLVPLALMTTLTASITIGAKNSSTNVEQLSRPGIVSSLTENAFGLGSYALGFGCGGGSGGAGGGDDYIPPTDDDDDDNDTTPTDDDDDDATPGDDDTTPTDDDDDDTTPSNRPPKFVTFPNTPATEGTLYEIMIKVSDQDGDNLTGTLLEDQIGGSLTKVDNSTFKYSANPTDAVSGAVKYIKVEISDGIDKTSQRKGIYVKNTETAEGWVGGFNIGEGLEGILVELDDGVNYYSALTNADGEWEIPGVLDGSFWFTMSDDANEYLEYQAGKLQVSKAQQGNMNTAFMLLPKSIQDYIQSVIYGDGSGNPLNLEAIARWTVKPQFKVYTKEYSTGNSVPQENLNLVMNAIKNKLTIFSQGVFGNFTDADIEFVNTVYPGGMPGEGIYVVNFDNSNANTSISQLKTDGSVKDAYIGLKISAGLPTILQELSSGMINDGETKSSSYTNSVFYNVTSPTATEYSDEDLICSMATYNPFWQRPIGTIFDPDFDSEIVPASYNIN